MNTKKQRSTFRNKVAVCWQYQKKLSYAKDRAPNIDLSLKTSKIKPISRTLAKQIIIKYEWLGTLPSCSHYFGLFFGMYCAGVTCVSVGGGGANVYAYKEFNLQSQNELAYLQRGANVHWAPTGANSKLVSWTARLVKKQTSAKIMIAYSDTDAGEIGTIYQACNWVCIGKGSSTNQFVSPDGRIYDQKLPHNMGKRYGKSRKEMVEYLLSNGFVRQKSNPKYRYVVVLDRKDKDLLTIVDNKKTEYPKRNAA